jgi:SAM-dependent methyltransferase
VTPDERWLAAVWPFIRAGLPAQPARPARPAQPAHVLVLGCGPLGGFVPMLRAAGYDATGVDMAAPDAPGYHRVEFERYDVPQPVEAIVACTALHHVADLAAVVRRLASALAPDGRLIVVEWARERLDAATAAWCFARLPGPENGTGWLHNRRAEWLASGQDWDTYLRSWATGQGHHSGRQMLAALAAHFVCRSQEYGPYFFPYLADVSEADEQAAIDAGHLQATRLQYVGTIGRAGSPGALGAGSSG